MLVINDISGGFKIWSGLMGGYLIAHLFGLLLCAPLAVFTTFAALNMVVSANVLLLHNISAYRELLDLVSMQVLVQLQKERAKMPENLTREQDTLVMNRTCNNPLIKALKQKLAKRERYLLAASHELLNGEIGTATNTIYALAIIGTFFVLFYIIIQVISLVNDSSSLADVRFRDVSFVAAMIVGFFVVLYLLVQPILGMAAHPQAWKDLLKSLRLSNRKEVSRTLSPSDDPNMLISHHASLEKSFTWRLLGHEISYAAIGTTLAGYFAILWTIVAVPVISKFAKDLQAQVGLNATGIS